MSFLGVELLNQEPDAQVVSNMKHTFARYFLMGPNDRCSKL